jgi:membrane glycosyltransferase
LTASAQTSVRSELPGDHGGGPASDDRVELPLDRLIGDWELAHRRAAQYASRLGYDEASRTSLAREAVRQAALLGDGPPEQLRSPVVASLAALRRILVGGGAGDADEPAFHRVCLERAGWAPRSDEQAPTDGHRLLATSPPTARSHMPASSLRRWGVKRAPKRRTGRDAWKWRARARRTLFAAIVLGQTAAATVFLLDTLPRKGGTPTEILIAALFAILFAWISTGLWLSMIGFWSVVVRKNRSSITRLLGGERLPELSANARVAVIMPICNEPVDRVYAGLQATYESLQRTGRGAHFDFYILSDTADPAAALREEAAWARLCRTVDGYGKIYYRRRKVRLRRKTGNVAEFCRRWGKRYPYMIGFDADSIMCGETMVRLVALIEKSPHAGLIQTRPQAINRRSIFGRIQQFSGRLYGPIFSAGLHWWQMGDGQYWGHNAVIRTDAFMAHCGLPTLPGKPPLGGEILSHDFVEAAMLGRAGWETWLAYDLEGSYEENPGAILEEMKRDRRWCQGNIQHLRLMFARGFKGGHRALFLNGVFSYVSAAVWFVFLVLSTYEAVADVFFPVNYFPRERMLFPEWPVWKPTQAILLTCVTAVVLFVPKILGIVAAVVGGTARGFGGFLRLLLSALLEIVFSTLMAPIRMVFHTRFVVLNLLGRTVEWKSAPREDEETGWGEAVRRHALDSTLASAWAIALYLLDPGYFWWITPILGALALSVPLSVLTSRAKLGDRVRKLGLFIIPEETSPPPELRDFAAHHEELRAVSGPSDADEIFAAAVRDPGPWALHLAMMRHHPRRLRKDITDARYATALRAVTEGPAGIGPRERRAILADPAIMTLVHEGVWSLPDGESAARWGLA